MMDLIATLCLVAMCGLLAWQVCALHRTVLNLRDDVIMLHDMVSRQASKHVSSSN